MKTSWAKYGHCPVCGWVHRLRKDGLTPEHYPKPAAGEKFVECPGSGKPVEKKDDSQRVPRHKDTI